MWFYYKNSHILHKKGTQYTIKRRAVYTPHPSSSMTPSPQGEGCVTPYRMRLVSQPVKHIFDIRLSGGLSQSCKIDKKRFFEQKWARCPFCSTKIRKNFLDWMGCLKSHNNPPWPLKNRILHRCRFRHTSYCRNLPPWIITILKRSWYEKDLKVANY